MTNGQMAPTTPVGARTTTTPFGRNAQTEGYPLRVCELLAGLDRAVFLARGAVTAPKEVRRLKQHIHHAFETQEQERGFSLVEILSPCPTYWHMTPQDALKRSFREADECDLMLVIGTSAQVEPAASLPRIAKGMHSLLRGLGGIPLMKPRCSVIEINWEPTPLTGDVSDFLIQGRSGDVLSAIEQKIREKKR